MSYHLPPKQSWSYPLAHCPSYSHQKGEMVCPESANHPIRYYRLSHVTTESFYNDYSKTYFPSSSGYAIRPGEVPFSGYGIYWNHAKQQRLRGSNLERLAEGAFVDGYLVSGVIYLENVYDDTRCGCEHIIYSGHFTRGVYHGNGVLNKYNGQRQQIWRYEGLFANGMMEGLGKEYSLGPTIFDEHVLYCGEWKNNKRHGRGKEFARGGKLVYDGEWELGVYSGKGQLSQANDLEYDGEFREGAKHGKGIQHRPFKFEGDWSEGRMVSGQLLEPLDGYQGDVIDKGEKTPFGQTIGSTDLIRHGWGKQAADPYTYEGEWANNQRQGRGKEYHDQGFAYVAYDGEFLNDKREGKGATYDVEGVLLYEGEFRAGEFHGEGRQYENGKLKYAGGYRTEPGGRFIPDKNADLRDELRETRTAVKELAEQNAQLSQMFRKLLSEFERAKQTPTPDTSNLRRSLDRQDSATLYQSANESFDHRQGQLVLEKSVGQPLDTDKDPDTPGVELFEPKFQGVELFESEPRSVDPFESEPQGVDPFDTNSPLAKYRGFMSDLAENFQIESGEIAEILDQLSAYFPDIRQSVAALIKHLDSEMLSAEEIKDNMTTIATSTGVQLRA